MRKLFIFFLISIVTAVSCKERKDIKYYASISFIVGTVKSNGNICSIGDQVKKGDTLETDEKSSCDVKIGDSLIRIKEKTVITFTEALQKEGRENTRLELLKGKMLCKPKKLIKDEMFIVNTPTVVAAVRGTQFSVATDKNETTRIKVFSGQVKAAKRVKAIESKIESNLDNSVPISQKESVTVSKMDLIEAENTVALLIAKNGGSDKSIDLSETGVLIKKDDLKPFKPGDFVDEKEIIEVEPKKEKEIKEIKKAIKKEPVPKGRILVTKTEIYFIKEGKIEWSSKTFSPPAAYEGMIFVADQNNVIGAKEDGAVIWNINIKNDGSLAIKNKNLVILSEGKEKKLNPKTGEKIK